MGRHDSDFLEVVPLTPLIPYCIEAPGNNLMFPCAPLTLPLFFADQNHLHQSMEPSLSLPFSLGHIPMQMTPFPAQSKLTLPLLPTHKPNTNTCIGSVHYLSETPLRQRGLRLKPDECDPDSFVVCNLCGNRILANREINLRNHARRHATLKQFQCRYCQYKHSEITKVRLHMAHKHDDARSRPINNVNAEMRHAWRSLMYDCFPDHFEDGEFKGGKN